MKSIGARLGWLVALAGLACSGQAQRHTAGAAGASAVAAGGSHGGVQTTTPGEAGESSGGGVTAGSGGHTGAQPSVGGGPPVVIERESPPNYQLTGSWPKQAVAIATKPGKLTYQKVEIESEYLAESCAIGDYDNDGKPDISSGRRWYAGPDFKTETIFRGGHEALPRTGESPEIDSGNSDDTADYAFDVNGDGWVDIINIASIETPDGKTPSPAPAPQRHASAYWYENPGAAPTADGMWTAHLIHDDVRGEQHGLFDIDGDGLPEFFGACKGCSPAETRGYYQANWQDPTREWTYHAVTQHVEFPFGGCGFLHGQGFNDVNGDGTPDLLERAGIWLNATAATPNTTVCPGAGCGVTTMSMYDGNAAANHGGAHMYAFDIDGDGDADIVSGDWAHGWGMAWYEQTTPGAFTRRQFLGSNSALDVATYGPVYFSEAHALQVADMDGDGVPDLITGKQRFAHPIGYGDPDAMGKPVLYVFRTIRNQPSAANGGSVTFEPHLVDEAVGVGRQVGVGHLNDDGIVDLCIASKLGLYAFIGV